MESYTPQPATSAGGIRLAAIVELRQTAIRRRLLLRRRERICLAAAPMQEQRGTAATTTTFLLGTPQMSAVHDNPEHGRFVWRRSGIAQRRIRGGSSLLWRQQRLSGVGRGRRRRCLQVESSPPAIPQVASLNAHALRIIYVRRSQLYKTKSGPFDRLIESRVKKSTLLLAFYLCASPPFLFESIDDICYKYQPI